MRSAYPPACLSNQTSPLQQSVRRHRSSVNRLSRPAPIRRAPPRQQPQQRRLFCHSTVRPSSMTSALLSATVTSPSSLSAQPEDAQAKAHHNRNGKGFLNPWDSYRDFTPFSIMRDMISLRLKGEFKTPDTTPPTVPVHKPVFLPTRETAKLRATWLGHACFFVEFPGGFRVLFDPVFTERCSPFSFLGPKRYTAIPCQISDIPIIDAVVISHSHYDHLSHPTIMDIASRHPATHFFVPLGNKAWFEKCGISSSRVTEMDWWEEKSITLSRSDGEDGNKPSSTTTTTSSSFPTITATISCLPNQHTSARTPFNKAHTLWASWSVRSGARSLWFAGDTGYRAVPRLPPSEFDYSDRHAHLASCPAFKQIGRHRGPFDLGLIPIGAYEPRSIMSPMHADPYDAVNIFVDTRCRRALGMHWGTWVLTSEPVMEPPRRLQEAMRWKFGLDAVGREVAAKAEPEEQQETATGEETSSFGVCDIGESREF